jgi:Protein of unknown function (DUF4054)
MPFQTTTIALSLTDAQFRADFPEFSDKTKYPANAFTYWATVATLLLNPVRWGSVLLMGMELFIAHNLFLEAQAFQTDKVGGWPGISKGAINNESAGEVTVSYDTVSALEADGGDWNLSVYGTRFLRWARMAGSGGMQIGPCGAGGSPGEVPGVNDNVGAAWSGPNVMPGTTSFS